MVYVIVGLGVVALALIGRARSGASGVTSAGDTGVPEGTTATGAMGSAGPAEPQPARTFAKLAERTTARFEGVVATTNVVPTPSFRKGVANG